MQTTNKLSTWLAWAMVTIFYAYQYMLRVMPNVTMPEIMSRFDMNANIFGQFAGAYYLGYAGMMLPIGIWLDRKGPKHVLPICITITSIGLLPMIYSNSSVMACAGRALVGFGSVAAALGIFKVVHLGFPGNQFPRMLGLSVSIGTIAAMYAGQPMGRLLEIYGYETVTRCLIYAGFILAAICLVVLPKVKATAISRDSLLNMIAQLWKTKKVFLIGLFAGLMVAPLEGFADAWGTSFLQAVHSHLNKDHVTFLPSLILFGMCIGSILLPYVADKTKNYYAIIASSAFVMAAAFIMFLSTSLSANVIAILMFVIGVMCAYQILAIYISTIHVKEHLIGTTTALVNTMIMSFGFFFHPIIGRILQATWDGKIVGVYSAQSFTYGISVIPIALIIGGLGFVLISRK